MRNNFIIDYKIRNIYTAFIRVSKQMYKTKLLEGNYLNVYTLNNKTFFFVLLAVHH